MVGIVLNSALIQAPEAAPKLFAQQEAWLKTQLEKAKAERVRQVALFQHHPFFVKDPAEPDAYANIPLQRRGPYLDLIQQYGVAHVFAGHSHRDRIARVGSLEIVISSPIGMPLEGGKSGMRIAIVRAAGIEHRYYELGDLPNRIDLTK